MLRSLQSAPARALRLVASARRVSSILRAPSHADHCPMAPCPIHLLQHQQQRPFSTRATTTTASNDAAVGSPPEDGSVEAPKKAKRAAKPKKRSAAALAPAAQVGPPPESAPPVRATTDPMPAHEPPSSSSSTFAGATMCVSGAFSVSQGALRELLAHHGASLVAAPSGTCTHLVASGLGSAKTKAAERRGDIDVVTEAWVRRSIAEGRMATASTTTKGPDLFLAGGTRTRQLLADQGQSEAEAATATASADGSPGQLQQRVDDLRTQIKHADSLYYGSASTTASASATATTAHSPLTDAEYDALYRELLALEKRYPRLRSLESPTSRPGGPSEEQLRTAGAGAGAERHRLAMLSLQSCTIEEKVRKWDASLRRSLRTDDDDGAEEEEEASGPGGRSSPTAPQPQHPAHLRYLLELKYDGIAVSTVYRGGKLYAVRTRGTGVQGEDIRAAAERWVKNIPRELRRAPRSGGKGGAGEGSESADWQDFLGGEIEVRGEVLLTTSAHLEYTRQMRAGGATTPEEDGSLAPARNLCAGLLRREEPESSGPTPPLVFVAYGLHILDGRVRHVTDYLAPPMNHADVPLSRRAVFPDTQTRALEIVRQMGFDTQPPPSPATKATTTETKTTTTTTDTTSTGSWLCPSIESAISTLRHWSVARSQLDFGIDGVVLKVDDLALATQLGATGHHPKGALAFKFPAKTTETTLEDVTWQVGREGKVVPVAVLTPVALDGVTIARASLHNCSVLQALGLRRGDRVHVERRGDVIPYVAGKVVDSSSVSSVAAVDPASSSDLIALPTVCPCHLRTPLVACSTAGDPSKFDLFCQSPSCPSQLVGRLVHYCSKAALDIDGMGRKTVEFLCQYGSNNESNSASGPSSSGGTGALLDSLESIVSLADRLEGLLSLAEEGGLPGWGEKRLRKLCANLRAAHVHATQEQLLIAAGIPRLGRAQAKALLKRFGTVEGVAQAKEHEMVGIPGIGPKLIPLFLASFQELQVGLLPQWRKYGYLKKPPA